MYDLPLRAAMATRLRRSSVSACISYDPPRRCAHTANREDYTFYSSGPSPFSYATIPGYSTKRHAASSTGRGGPSSFLLSAQLGAMRSSGFRHTRPGPGRAFVSTSSRLSSAASTTAQRAARTLRLGSQGLGLPLLALACLSNLPSEGLGRAESTEGCSVRLPVTAPRRTSSDIRVLGWALPPWDNPRWRQWPGKRQRASAPQRATCLVLRRVGEGPDGALVLLTRCRLACGDNAVDVKTTRSPFHRGFQEKAERRAVVCAWGWL